MERRNVEKLLIEFPVGLVLLNTSINDWLKKGILVEEVCR